MGEPDKTCYQVRRAVKELFNSGINGYPGDEDTGSMAAWYILSTLGFYPFTPATGEYVLAAPSVKKAIIHTGYGNNFIIEAENFGKDNIYAAKITENGSEIDRTYITHRSIKEGMTLKFTLTNEPTGKAYNKTPFSIGKKQ
ncbi:MAG: glycoside hydrolase family 92 protein, partial [Clostridia bacterium]|nr:glycoside hydrolase family 92 protein [Clostridia bacterium]